MRKLSVVVAMVLLLALLATPAIAKISRVSSGSASPRITVLTSGSNNNVCVPAQQVANTGNVVNEQDLKQYDTESGDISLDGSSITIDPTLDASCTQSIAQSV
jgi:hypothetical protein